MITVVAIIAILTALMTVVFLRVKSSAKVTRSISNMHQFGVAIALYQADWASPGGSSVGAQGFPPGPLEQSIDLPMALYHTGGELTNRDDPESDLYTRMFPWWNEEPFFVDRWNDYYSLMGDQSVIMVDNTQCPGLRPGGFSLHAKLALGLHLDTHVSKKMTTGDATAYSCWTD
jgi:hypothetical protein